MELPTLERVDARLATLLEEFPRVEITERQRAEDLVASALTMYAAVFRRFREIHQDHEDHERMALWTQRDPLSGLLALHHADTPAPAPIESADVRRATDSIERIVDDLDGAPAPVRDRSLEMLAIVSDLHEAGLAQITGAIDDALLPPPQVRAVLAGDDLVASVLLIHGLHFQTIESRVENTVIELQRLSGPVATVDLVDVGDAGHVRLRVSAENQGDAYRLRLNVERVLAERVPDLASVTVIGGDEPVPPTTAFIPLESLTVRRPSPAVDVAP